MPDLNGGQMHPIAKPNLADLVKTFSAHKYFLSVKIEYNLIIITFFIPSRKKMVKNKPWKIAGFEKFIRFITL